MEKYRLVYEMDNIETDIQLKGTDDEYTNLLELCFIDAFTTVYNNQAECNKYLYEKGIIDSCYGKLVIKRKSGNVSATEILYKDSDMRPLSLEVCTKLRNKQRTILSETKEFKKSSSGVISFFYSDDEAISYFKKSYLYKKYHMFSENLSAYLEYKNHSTFYEPSDICRREEIKSKIYRALKNYEVLRDIKIWIDSYQNRNTFKYSSSTWKNPYDEFEKRREESEIRHNEL